MGVAPDAPKEEKQRYVMEKYREPRSLDQRSADVRATMATASATEQTEQPSTTLSLLDDVQPLVEEKMHTKVIRRAPVAAAAWTPPAEVQGQGRLVAKKADIPDDF